MCSKFIPQMLARKVGTAMIAADRRDLADDLVLLDPEQGQVRLEDAGQQLALAGDLLVDAAGVIGDVAEVALELLVDRGVGAALERLERRQQRERRPVELDHLALEEVDALGRIGGVLEDLLLDLLDVVLDPGDDRRVVVDDLVEDRPDDGAGAALEQLRVLLQPPAGRLQLAGGPVADRDHVGRPGEEVDLPELDLLASRRCSGPSSGR